MRKKELHKLRKTDLLTIIYEQQKSIESLKDEIKGLEGQLKDKDKKIEEMGTITEASIRINKIFEVAESAEKYLNSLKKVNELEIQSEMHYITNEEKQTDVNENQFNINTYNIEEKNVNIVNNIEEQPIIEKEFSIENRDTINEYENTNEKESQTIEKVESKIMLIPSNVALATIMPKFTTRLRIAICVIFNRIKVFFEKRMLSVKNFFKTQQERTKILIAKRKVQREENRLKKEEDRLKKAEKRSILKVEHNAKKEENRLKKEEKRNLLIAKRKAIKEARRLKKEAKRRVLIAKRITRKLKRLEHRKRLVTRIKTINEKTKNSIKNINRVLKAKISNNIDKMKTKRYAKKENNPLTAMQISLEDIEHEINIRKKKESKLKFTSTFLFASTVVIAVAIITATSFFRILQVNGNSMEPSLQDGELLITSKFFKFKKGDIVAFYYNDKILIKRVIATEGEIVSMDDDGSISVNGTKLEEDYVSELDYGKCDITFPYKVPENSVFILGDNRKVSLDSRSSSIGCILCDNIIGKINLRVKPFKLF